MVSAAAEGSTLSPSSSRKPSFECDLIPVHMDFATHRATFGGILRWCESLYCTSSMFPALLSHQLEAIESSLSSSVSRRHVIRVYCLAKHWPQRSWYKREQPVRACVSCSSCGNTSIRFRFRFAVNTDLIAEVESTSVCVDGETFSKPQRIPYQKELRAAIGENIAPLSLLLPPAAGTSVHYTWRQPVRWTDCDEYGHINNCVYATLAEEARAVAADALGKASPEDGAWLCKPVGAMEIENMRQLRPGELLEISVCWDARLSPTEERCCMFRFEAEGALMATVRAELFGEAMPVSRL
eukprot:TRINITY_DN73886_c0_g1_i1.p1 TRINITY_DN73886_c0_g1~~TRINITY_DN73886_c0_g1_i1.p1  ORF type:complete len:325 (+),score=31.48 TRINITY_DN73886_c0_g1_i1:87-977(+)